MRYRRLSAHQSLVGSIGSDEIDGVGVGPASPRERRNGIGEDLWDDRRPDRHSKSPDLKDLISTPKSIGVLIGPIEGLQDGFTPVGLTPRHE